MCLTSPHRRVVAASASSGGEEGRRQVSKAWFWDLQANCWKTSALAPVQSFLLIVVSAQENTWWPAMEKLFEREERDAVGAQAQRSSQVTPQPRHNAKSSLLNPTIFILYYLECLGSFFFLFSVLSQKLAASVFLFKTSNKSVQNTHAVTRACCTPSAQVAETLRVWMRQTNTTTPAADQTNIPFQKMSFWQWHVSRNQRHRGPHRDRGPDRDCCPRDAVLPPANHRGTERGAGEAQAQPSAHLAPRRSCLRTQGVNKGKIFQTILM